MPQGSAIKCQAVYDRPFWRDDGLTGQVAERRRPVRITYDNSPPDGRPGVLLGFIEGELARALGRAPGRASGAPRCSDASRVLRPGGRQPERYIEMRLGGGGVDAGLLRRLHAARRPARLRRGAPRARSGAIHWAGTETATYWNGYMEGAVRSGERAAAETPARRAERLLVGPARELLAGPS